MGRTGRQGALARSRSQLNSAVKAGRTVVRKVIAARVSTLGLAAAAMPAPHTSRTAAPLGNGRWQSGSSKRPACWTRPRAWITASRGAPLTTRTGMRSPRPSTSQRAWPTRLATTTGPLKPSRKCWSSSIWLPS